MNFARDKNRIQILDTTNRDGEQGTQGPKYPDSKLIIAKVLEAAKFDRIEAGFPSSSQGDFESVQKIAREIDSSMVFGLSPVPIDVEGKRNVEPISITYDAIKDAQYPGIHVFSIMFDPKSLKAYGYTREEVVEGAATGVAYARKLLGTRGQVEFSFQNAASAPLEWVIAGYRKMVEAGANVINYPDTNGSCLDEEIRNGITLLRYELPEEVMISCHMHDDQGVAVANSLAAVRAGADIVEGTINGIGERAGNTALEEVILAVHKHNEFFGGRQTNVDKAKLNYLSALVSEHYGIPVPEHKAIVGKNAFRHRSGIRQDGMVKGSVYEFIDPATVGWTGETFELSARSGSAGVGQRLQRLGYDVSPEFVRREVMPVFKALADEKRSIGDQDLTGIMAGLQVRK